jgi:hypothetical protein
LVVVKGQVCRRHGSHFIHNGVHGIDEGTHDIKKDAHVNDMGGIDYGMVEHLNHMVHMSLTMYAHVNNKPPPMPWTCVEANHVLNKESNLARLVNYPVHDDHVINS